MYVCTFVICKYNNNNSMFADGWRLTCIRVLALEGLYYAFMKNKSLTPS